MQGQFKWWHSSPYDHRPQRHADGGSNKFVLRALWLLLGDDVCRLLHERDEARALYSNAVCDLGWMDFHLSAMQDALTISENRSNTVQMRLAKAEARIIGENSLR